MKIERIVAAVDLGPETEHVLAYASLFAKEASASLSLLTVIDFLVTPPTYLSPYLEEEKRVSAEGLRSWEKVVRDHGVSARSEVIVGRIHESCDAAMKKDRADMLVLGFRSHALRRSSSEKLIKGLRAPMLVVRGEKALTAKVGSVQVRRILCPTDISQPSVTALEIAQQLSGLFSSELQVVHILNRQVLEKIKNADERDKANQEMVRQAREVLDKFLKGYGVERPGVIEEGEPFARISSFSREHDADLIVMGARGLSLVKGMLIGSVTDAVLRSSPCPVLVVH